MFVSLCVPTPPIGFAAFGIVLPLWHRQGLWGICTLWGRGRGGEIDVGTGLNKAVSWFGVHSKSCRAARLTFRVLVDVVFTCFTYASHVDAE